jgi:hypothetical protein
MILEVPFSDFAETLKRHAEKESGAAHEAYLKVIGHGICLTALLAKPARVLVSYSTETEEEIRTKMAENGIELHIGGWDVPERAETPESSLSVEHYVAVVAYKSEEAMPGVWVDAFPQLPSPSQVLRALYDEFRDTGEIGSVSFEEFVRLSHPNVTIVSPTDLDHFVNAKSAIVQSAEAG